MEETIPVEYGDLQTSEVWKSDKIDKLAADGSPAAKLQIERLSGRLKLERKRNIRSAYNQPYKRIRLSLCRG